MRISVDVAPQDIEPAVNWISGLAGTWLDKRVNGFEQHQRRNPMVAMYYEETFALEFKFAKARSYRKSTGRLPKGPEWDPLYSFLVSAQRIYTALPPVARKSFEGRFRDATYGLRPFAYEIGIATHLMGRQWDVEFTDFSGSARFDFLAEKNATALEVECKTTSGDTGRKLHRHAVNRLADLILPITTKLADQKGCHVLRIRVPDRLSTADQELKEIANSVAKAIPNGTVTASEGTQVTHQLMEVTSWPDPREDVEAYDFFRNLVGRDNPHLMLHGRGDEAIAVVCLESATPDQVVDAIAAQAKDAAKQCTGTRPALIVINLADRMDRDKLGSLLNTSNGLHRIAHEVFKDGKRDHVDSIIYTVPQDLRFLDGARRQMSAPAIALYNPNPKFSCPEARMAFRAT